MAVRDQSGGGGAAGNGLREEIGKRRPFDLPEQEAYLNLIRTEAVLTALGQAIVRPFGLSEATYNALRILRGATLGESPPGQRSCREIGAHLVARVPDVTRLVDRLVRMGLAERDRCEKDRRVVYVRITRKGLDLLARLDRPILEMHRAQLGHLTRAELAELSRLLVKAREPHLREDPHEE
ncbi:MAG: MarR family winged helix-turn-helix transcriptional regulator [Phycisphaerales bacterium]